MGWVHAEDEAKKERWTSLGCPGLIGYTKLYNLTGLRGLYEGGQIMTGLIVGFLRSAILPFTVLF